MPAKPSDQQLAQLNAALRDPAVAAQLQQIRSDPRYAGSVPLQWNAINSFLFNDPRSPLSGLNQPGQSTNRGNGAYRYDIETNSIKWEPLGPQHWYTDPGVVGPLAVGAAAGGFGLPSAFGGAGTPGATTFDALPNIASASGAANAAALGAGNATLPTAMTALAQGAGFDTAPNIGTAAGAANAAGMGDLPSSSIPGLSTAVPQNVASQGASSGVPFATTGGTSLLHDILNNVKKYAPVGLAGANALRQLTQGAPQAQQDLESILKLAEGRINQTEPLFQALNAMSQAGLPDYAKGIR